MKKILIVEDNEVIVKGLKYLLTQENFEVKTCGNVNDAKNSISSEKFDLIILDITLPDGNGFELCKKSSYCINDWHFQCRNINIRFC